MSAPSPRKKPRAADRLRAFRPRTRTVYMFTPDPVREEYEQAKAARQLAALAGDADDATVKAAQRREDVAAQAVRDKSERFRFQALGGAFGELLRKHPPSDEDKQRSAEQGMSQGFNSDTFPPALVYNSMVEPDKDELSEDEFLDLWNGPLWNEGDKTALFQGALIANQERSGVDLGN